MPQIKYVSDQPYHSVGYHFAEPFVYDVSEEKAKQLLSDFPQWFEAVEGGSSAQQSANDEGTQAKPLSKMNKGELVARAEELGLDVNGDMSNKELQKAIEEHQKEA